MLLYSLLLVIARNLDGNSPSGHTESIHKATHTSYMWNFRVKDGEMQQLPVIPRIMIILLTSLQAALLPPFCSLFETKVQIQMHIISSFPDCISKIEAYNLSLCWTSPCFVFMKEHQSWIRPNTSASPWNGVHLYTSEPRTMIQTYSCNKSKYLIWLDWLSQISVQGRAKTHIFVTSGSL